MVNSCIVTGCKRESYPGCGVSFHKNRLLRYGLNSTKKMRDYCSYLDFNQCYWVGFRRSLQSARLRFGGVQVSVMIPTNEERRDLWIKAMRLKTNVSKNALVCGRHFNDEDYFSQAKCRLKPDAVPSIILPMIVPVIKNIVVRSNTLEVGLSDSDNSMTAADTEHEGPFEPSEYHDAVNIREDSEVSEEPSVKKLKLADIGTQTDKWLSPETEKLRRDIKVLRLRLRRYETKIVNLKTILDVVLKKKKMKIIRS